jgi:histidine ammonia-lyase
VSGNQEDHVSMSAGAAFSFREVVESVQTVVAIELLCAAEAVEYVDRVAERPDHEVPPDEDLELGGGTNAAYETVRTQVAPLGADREVHADIDRLRGLVASGQLVDHVTDHVDLE